MATATYTRGYGALVAAYDTLSARHGQYTEFTQ